GGKINVKRFSIYTILILFAIVNVYPIFWMVMNSFKTAQDFSKNKLGLPEKFIFQNYIDAWNAANFQDFFINSMIVSVTAVIITVLFGALAAYFLSRFSFKMNRLIYGFFIFGLLVPIHATLVPMFIFMQNIGLLNTRLALILPYVAFNLPITIFLLYS